MSQRSRELSELEPGRTDDAGEGPPSEWLALYRSAECVVLPACADLVHHGSAEALSRAGGMSQGYRLTIQEIKDVQIPDVVRRVYKVRVCVRVASAGARHGAKKRVWLPFNSMPLSRRAGAAKCELQVSCQSF